MHTISHNQVITVCVCVFSFEYHVKCVVKMFFVPSPRWVTVFAYFSSSFRSISTPFLFLFVPSHSFISSFPMSPPSSLMPLTSVSPFHLLSITSSSCGTQQDRSASESPWCNTTIATFTLCSSCTTWRAQPASAAWCPGWKSVGRTCSDMRSPGICP